MPIQGGKRGVGLQVQRRRYARKAKVSKPVKSYVKKAIAASKESNYFNYSVTGTELNYDNAYIYDLSAVPQGDDISSREGDRIEPTSFMMKGAIANMATTTVARIMIVQWKPNTSDENLTSIEDVLYGGSNLYSPHCLPPPDKSQRLKFKILYDRVFSNTTGATQTIAFNANVMKFANKYVNYNDSSTGGKSKIFLIGTSNVAAASSGPTIVAQGRLRWRE